ncbi:LSU ribosomal protein L17p [Candidatus Kuenenia stuttgartiensis]|uniref:50S ribosomal protein L17 n=1 Tax=Kuenenia stuttgartiensis TaxID=174633 RepID=Q1Q167_KUEST|nr:MULTISPECIES: 50S ribosomal protein L17 [Kuenenia]MBE7547851.1 50S ribosomal protein L17 [Planctomycetia bacterium]MBW7943490.1 50S ribosomal protein L17 [Candidatus Kuenenia stuttgartiensis]MBZ0191206.1 50S ribosomal protein L17 [Candidatus Kuenenia stuttgartiensis]MCF6152394.1 50S ribosomal protein L17 [Candidatus Kuenenia stuttgartiensis]MCL4726109.1 50S ribosomal protein L17 [Candidatus Kuenenia stuttgartiensis]
MRHGKRGRHLSRTSAHRKALRQNIANSLFIHGRIVTTVEKAKETRSFVEKIITIAKKGLDKKESDRPGYVHCYRQVLSRLKNVDIVKKIFGEGDWRESEGIAKRFTNRNGGYTRILKLSGTRLGVLSGSSVGKIPELEYSMGGICRKLRLLGRRLNDNASLAIFELVETETDVNNSEEIKPKVATSSLKNF